MKKKPNPAKATMTKMTSAAKTPTIHKMTFAPEDFGGAGGIPPGVCGLIDGVDMAFSFWLRKSSAGGFDDWPALYVFSVLLLAVFCLNSEFPQMILSQVTHAHCV
jgi:hypothetical protein